MNRNDDVSRGVARLAVAAFRDREFFERLLKNPRRAAEGKREELDLSDDDIEKVVEFVEAATRERDTDELLAMWADYREHVAIWPEQVDIWPERIGIWPEEIDPWPQPNDD